jgi:hypothetical protein
MDYDTLIFPFPHDEQSVPVRISSVLWARLLRAAEAGGALVLERYNATDARTFARAVRAALEPPATAAAHRYAQFFSKPDPGAPLRDPEVRPLVEMTLEVFERGAVLVQPRATPSALRVVPGRDFAGVGQVGKKRPVEERPAPAR